MSNLFRKFASGFFNNLKTIIQAVVFSIIIWFVISIQIFPNITLHISNVKLSCTPTQYMLNENLQIASVDTENVTIQVQGKRYSITNLTNEDFTASCDLSGIYESGEHTVNVVVEPTDKSTECEILSGNITAKVLVKKIVSREFQISTSANKVSVSDGMQIEGALTVSPSTVVVTGEEKLVNSIGKVEAEPVYTDPLEESAELRGELVFYNQAGVKMISPEISTNEKNFTVSIPVYKVKTLPLNVKFTNYPANFDADTLKYSMSLTELTIASPDSSVDNLDEIDIGEISLNSLTLKDLQGGVALPVKLPDGYKNISGNKTVMLYFEDYDNFGQLGFTVPSDNINVINAPSNFDVKVLTNLLTVNVVGLSSYIQEMTSDDIYATVNLLGLELSEGTKTVSVTFRLAGTNTKAWVTGEEYKVELQISAQAEN